MTPGENPPAPNPATPTFMDEIRKHQDDEQRLLQVARTIADIDEKQGLTEGHIAEAAQLTEHLRRYPRNEWTTNTTGAAATADIIKAYT